MNIPNTKIAVTEFAKTFMWPRITVINQLRRGYCEWPRRNLSKKKVHPLYNTWSRMLGRCYNKNDTNYSHYGGRGITVCDSWRADFNKFIEDMGPKPSSKYTLDRIDVNGNYCKDNCRWTIQSVQLSNKRGYGKLPYKGISIKKATGKYQVYITLNRQSKHLGYFQTLEEALSAKQNAEI
jgi:hypothetical protein